MSTHLEASTVVLRAALAQLGARRGLTPPSVELSTELKGDFKVSRERILVSASAMSKGDPVAFCNRILDCLQDLNEKIDREAREWLDFQRDMATGAIRRLYRRSPSLVIEVVAEALAMEGVDGILEIHVPMKEE
jgi:hypothetical protein